METQFNIRHIWSYNIMVGKVVGEGGKIIVRGKSSTYWSEKPLPITPLEVKLIHNFQCTIITTTTLHTPKHRTLSFIGYLLFGRQLKVIFIDLLTTLAVVVNRRPASRSLGLGAWICHFPDVWLWATSLISLGLHFSICKTGFAIPSTSLGGYGD